MPASCCAGCGGRGPSSPDTFCGGTGSERYEVCIVADAMTESNAVQRLSRAARRQGLKLSFRQNPERRYRLTDPCAGRTIIDTESLIDIERFLSAGEPVSIYADYYLRL